MTPYFHQLCTCSISPKKSHHQLILMANSPKLIKELKCRQVYIIIFDHLKVWTRELNLYAYLIVCYF